MKIPNCLWCQQKMMHYSDNKYLCESCIVIYNRNNYIECDKHWIGMGIKTINNTDYISRCYIDRPYITIYVPWKNHYLGCRFSTTDPEISLWLMCGNGLLTMLPSLPYFPIDPITITDKLQKIMAFV